MNLLKSFIMKARLHLISQISMLKTHFESLSQRKKAKNPSPILNNLCIRHGGALSYGNEILCDICARDGVNRCPCGSSARRFGEALMTSVSCETCHEFVMGVDLKEDIRDYWNRGERGFIEEEQ